MPIVIMAKCSLNEFCTESSSSLSYNKFYKGEVRCVIKNRVLVI